jgi:hypothetical protein
MALVRRYQARVRHLRSTRAIQADKAAERPGDVLAHPCDQFVRTEAVRIEVVAEQNQRVGWPAPVGCSEPVADGKADPLRVLLGWTTRVSDDQQRQSRLAQGIFVRPGTAVTRQEYEQGKDTGAESERR